MIYGVFGYKPEWKKKALKQSLGKFHSRFQSCIGTQVWIPWFLLCTFPSQPGVSPPPVVFLGKKCPVLPHAAIWFWSCRSDLLPSRQVRIQSRKNRGLPRRAKAMLAAPMVVADGRCSLTSAMLSVKTPELQLQGSSYRHSTDKWEAGCCCWNSVFSIASSQRDAGS